MNDRSAWQGMRTIFRFNQPLYLAALVVWVCAVLCLFLAVPLEVKVVGALAAVGSCYFLLVSLGVSHWIYDRSDLYHWRWLERALAGQKPEQVIFCHSGFDEASAMLKKKLDGAEWKVIDHYDSQQMSEPSIRRARKLYPPALGTIAAPHHRWPSSSDSADVIFGLLAIHELRTLKERAEWFAEAGRCLKKDGRIIIVEHVRDIANFIAFGPGFLHFHSPENWRKSWESAGLHMHDQFRITPFVRVFIITPHG